MTIDLDALRVICDAATPGPWSVGEDEQECAATVRAAPVVSGQSEPCGPPVDVIIPFGRAFSDARFIATARTAVPQLVSEVERLTREVNERETFDVEVAGEINREVERLTRELQEARSLYANDMEHFARVNRRVDRLTAERDVARAEVERTREVYEAACRFADEERNDRGSAAVEIQRLDELHDAVDRARGAK
jgi:hypothetical protein